MYLHSARVCISVFVLRFTIYGESIKVKVIVGRKHHGIPKKLKQARREIAYQF